MGCGRIALVLAAAVWLLAGAGCGRGAHSPVSGILSEELEVAVRASDANEVARLLQGGAPVDALYDGGWTALHIAAQVGANECIVLLLDAGADIDRRNDKDSTPLHTAILNQRISTVKLLMDRGADIRADFHGYSVLWLAGSTGNAELFNVIRERTQGIYTRDELLENFHNLLRHDSQMEIVRVLIHDIGLEFIDEPNSLGSTALLIACGSYNAEELALMLLELGADPNRTTARGQNALMEAAKTGLTKVVQELIRRGQGMHARDNLQRTPLHLAADHGAVEVVKILLSAGADPNSRDIGASTPLHAAAKQGMLEAARILLAHGANPDAQDSQFHTPADRAETPELRELLTR